MTRGKTVQPKDPMERYRVPLPALDPQGTYTIRQVSRLLDNLLGDARRERAVRRRLEQLSRPK